MTTILFNQSEIEIHLTARGRKEEEAKASSIGSHRDRGALGNAVFSFAGETMEEVVGLKIVRRKLHGVGR